ncbi:hypothetical protein N4G70_25840 [Streptomyces sp. ASQP_92]|uniref:hypothetical protein n=1 Tax=Streptomyces sp. ASQP_92 TaxID=2979116 RepID=UPI0021BE27F7|nr:hypothetical protein [Streptomyces sp. ASQP_92]MCT9092268.1 hypothetical protein [Streptomyces sp. ASQP_92]
MVLVAVFLPNLMLLVVLALARYEERVLGGSEPVEEPRGRHLVAVPDLPEAETGARHKARPHRSTAARGRHAA